MDSDDDHHHHEGHDDRATKRRWDVSQNIAPDARPVREVPEHSPGRLHYINDDTTTHSNFFPNNPYGRRCPTKPTLAPLVTTTRFDDDQTFVGVAQDMIIKFEHHSMTEREAILSTLKTAEERRAFLDALDFKYANLNLEDDNDVTGVADVVVKAGNIFVSTLQTMWKESRVEKTVAAATPTTVASEASFFAEAGMVDSEKHVADEYYSIHHPPKTPKNIAMSPVECTYGSSKVSTGIILSPVSYNNESQNNHQKASKKRRRWFFAETSTRVDPEGAFRSDRVTPTRPDRSKKRYSFDFKIRSSAWEHPKSSLVGGPSTSISHSMMPVATSPIRRVSIDPEQSSE